MTAQGRASGASVVGFTPTVLPCASHRGSDRDRQNSCTSLLVCERVREHSLAELPCSRSTPSTAAW